MIDYDKMSREELIREISAKDESVVGGIRLTYPGQAAPWQIVRRIAPRSQKIDAKLSVGSEADQACNLLVEGENLQALVSLSSTGGRSISS